MFYSLGMAKKWVDLLSNKFQQYGWLCLPSGNQTWHLEIHSFHRSFNRKIPISIVYFPASHVWVPEGSASIKSH